MKQNLITIALAALLIVGISGCRILSPLADPTEYYVLKSKSQGSISSTPKLSVGVGPVIIPGYLERDEIVSGSSSNNLKFAEYHVWSEPLDKAITHVAARNISRLLSSPEVVPFPDADIDIDQRLEIVIRRFEMGADDKIHLDASYFIGNATGSQEESTSRSRNIIVDVTNPQSHDAIVEAMSTALGKLSESMARDLLAFRQKN